MSLINQMLRDLEQRKQGQAAQPMALDVSPAQAPVASRRYWPWLLVAMALSIFYAWNDRHTSPASPQPVQARELVPTLQPMVTAQVTPAATVTPQPTAMPHATTMSQPLATAKVVAKPHEVKTTKPLATPRPLRSQSSSKSKVQALLQQAKGNVSLMMRKETLKEALLLDPDNLAIRDQLLQTLLKSGSASELDNFLQDSLRMYPRHLAFVTSQAQMQIQRKDFAAATATLERVDSSEPAYLSLLAASYQQQKRHHNAAEIYQRLTQMQPERAENWLGLAVSADHLHQRQTAVQAYRQALEKNTLNNDVVDYINQRLSALN